MNNLLNNEVTNFLDQINPSLRGEIECLRSIIMSTGMNLIEGIKWNAPNYSINGNDRITLRINSPKMIQIIFHRGAKVQEQPPERILDDKYTILLWKENDRAIASFKSLNEIQDNILILKEIITKWIESTT